MHDAAYALQEFATDASQLNDVHAPISSHSSVPAISGEETQATSYSASGTDDSRENPEARSASSGQTYAAYLGNSGFLQM